MCRRGNKWNRLSIWAEFCLARKETAFDDILVALAELRGDENF
jgi:hypothetical protein